MSAWRVFNVSAKTPDKISAKLERLLSNLERDGYEICVVSGPSPMAITEGARERGILDKVYENVVLTTFTAFVCCKKSAE